MNEEDMVIQVNDNDEQIGLMPKMEAHEKGVLHRAISVFLFTTDGRWILQRRAVHKYHSGGLWSNTCCSHPLPFEDSLTAAIRRLAEEMGMHAELRKLFNFKYKAGLDNGLIEHELDHIFVGVTDEVPRINSEEVYEWRYASTDEIRSEIKKDKEVYTAWFRLMFEEVYEKLKKTV